MIITIYENFSKRINSLKTPVGGANIDVTLKSDTSIITPSFEITGFNKNYNYLKWEDRYYYIVDIVSIRNNLTRIDCNLDVLASFKTDILNTNAFVRYSTSKFNVMLPEQRISSGVENTIKTSYSKLFDVQTSGTYILTYTTSQPTVGPSGVVLLNQTGANMLADALSSTSFADAIKDIPKTFQSVYDSVISLKYVPFNLIADSAGTKEIILGNYATGVYGTIPRLSGATRSCAVSIPTTYNDFRKLKPYRKLLLNIPCFGFVELDPLDYVNKSQVVATLTIDTLVGTGVINIDDILKVDINLACDISIGSVSNRGIGMAIGSLVASGVMLATGNIIGAAAGAFGAVVAGSNTTLGTTGGNGGIANTFAVPSSNIPGYVMAVTIDNGTNVEPSSLANAYGRPLNEVCRLGDLTGYIECVNASVNTNANTQIKNEINSYLNGGVYND